MLAIQCSHVNHTSLTGVHPWYMSVIHPQLVSAHDICQSYITNWYPLMIYVSHPSPTVSTHVTYQVQYHQPPNVLVIYSHYQVQYHHPPYMWVTYGIHCLAIILYMWPHLSDVYGHFNIKWVHHHMLQVIARIMSPTHVYITSGHQLVTYAWHISQVDTSLWCMPEIYHEWTPVGDVSLTYTMSGHQLAMNKWHISRVDTSEWYVWHISRVDTSWWWIPDILYKWTPFGDEYLIYTTSGHQLVTYAWHMPDIYHEWTPVCDEYLKYITSGHQLAMYTWLISRVDTSWW